VKERAEMLKGVEIAKMFFKDLGRGEAILELDELELKLYKIV